MPSAHHQLYWHQCLILINNCRGTIAEYSLSTAAALCQLNHYRPVLTNSQQPGANYFTTGARCFANSPHHRPQYKPQPLGVHYFTTTYYIESLRSPRANVRWGGSQMEASLPNNHRPQAQRATKDLRKMQLLNVLILMDMVLAMVSKGNDVSPSVKLPTQ